MAEQFKPIEEEDNAGTEYREYRQRVDDDAFIREADAVFEVPNDEPGVSENGAAPVNIFAKPPDNSIEPVKEPFFKEFAEIRKIDPSIDFTADVIGDIFTGVFSEGVPQAVRGIKKGLTETGQFITDLGAIAVDLGLPDGALQIKDAEGNFDVRFVGAEELTQARDEGTFRMFPTLDEGKEARSVTGGLVSGVAQFLVGFPLALKAVRGGTGFVKGVLSEGKEAVTDPTTIQKAGAKATAISEFALADMVAAAITLDPHEDRLSAFLVQFPALAPIVPEYLADNDPANESVWEGRMKNAIEGAGIGVFAESLVTAFRGYRAARNSRAQKDAEIDPFDRFTTDQAMKEINSTFKVKVTEEELAPLGDPKSDSFIIRAGVKDTASEEAVQDLTEFSNKLRDIVQDPVTQGRAVTEDEIADLDNLTLSFKKRIDEAPKGLKQKIKKAALKDFDFLANEVKRAISDTAGMSKKEKIEKVKAFNKAARSIKKTIQSSKVKAKLTPEEIAERRILDTESRTPKRSIIGRGAKFSAGFPEGDKISVNVAKIEAPEDIKTMIQELANSDAEAINAKSGGKRKGFDEMIKESGQEFTDLRLLIGRDPGPMTASESIAARKIWVSSTERVVELAAKAESGNAQMSDLYNFKRASVIHHALTAEIIGARREAGRAVVSWKIPVGGDEVRGEAIARLMETTGGASTIAKSAKAILALSNNPARAGQAISKFGKPTFGEALNQLWINAILSNIKTQVVNVLGNSLTASYAIPRRLMSASLSQTVGDGSIQFAEVTAQAYGVVKGFKDGIRLLAHGEKAKGIGDLKVPFDAMQQLEGTQRNSIVPEAFGLPIDGMWGTGFDYVAKIFNIPLSFLQGGDTVFKSIGYRMEVDALSIRQAMSEGLEGNALQKRIDDLQRNPPEDIKLAGMDNAAYQTFTTPLGEMGRKIVSGVSAVGFDLPILGRIPAGRFISPFMRTPANIMKQSFEGTPLSLFAKNTQANLAAGGPRATEEWAKITLGTMIMMSMADLAQDDVITGPPPTDPRLKRNWQRLGKTPWSVKVGDRWVAYDRLDPVGNIVGFGATIGQIVNNLDEPDAELMIATGVTSFMQNLASKRYLRSVFSFIAAVDPSNFSNTPQDWAQNQAVSFTPFSSLLRGISNTIDPTLRITRTAVGDPDVEPGLAPGVSVFLKETSNQFMSLVPGWSETLPIRRDLWGEPIVISSGYSTTFEFLSPIYSRVQSTDPLDKLIFDQELLLSHVPRSIAGVPLTGVEQDEYARLAGQPLKAFLDEKIQEPGFKRLSDGTGGGKEAYIQRQIRRFRENAQRQMQRDFPALKDRIDLRRNALQVKLRAVSDDFEVDPTVGVPVLPIPPDAPVDSRNIEAILGGIK